MFDFFLTAHTYGDINQQNDKLCTSSNFLKSMPHITVNSTGLIGHAFS